jgi:hypothetical protein
MEALKLHRVQVEGPFRVHTPPCHYRVSQVVQLQILKVPWRVRTLFRSLVPSLNLKGTNLSHVNKFLKQSDQLIQAV